VHSSGTCGRLWTEDKVWRDLHYQKGTTLNYLGMIFDLSVTGEARVSMTGYIDDMLESCGVTGGAVHSEG
jgi:hypothetical protein